MKDCRVDTSASLDGKVGSIDVTVNGVTVRASGDMADWKILLETLLNNYNVMRARQGLPAIPLPGQGERRGAH